MEIKNQVVALIRFSFATIGNFYPGFDTVEEMEGFLYDPERLKRRFILFEAFCLPSLRQQTDPYFTCVILVGANMPAEWKARLRELTEGIGAVRIIEAEPQHHYSGIKAAFAEVPTDGFTHRTTVRFDDDDAIDDGFIARLKAMAPKVAALGGGEAPAAIAHNLGFYLERREDKTVVYPVCERTPLGLGAALIAPVSYRENIYQANHRHLPQLFDCYSDTRHYTFVRTVHRDNKANPQHTGVRMKMPNKEIDALMRQCFGRKLGQFKHLPEA